MVDEEFEVSVPENRRQAAIYHPSPSAIKGYLLGTARHVAHVHYWLEKFGVDAAHMGEMPHDLGGIYNKLYWGVIEGLAVPYESKERLDQLSREEPLKRLGLIVLTARSRKRHRESAHHRTWRSKDFKMEDGRSFLPFSKMEAVADVPCAMSENRPHHSGQYFKEKGFTFGEILKKFEADKGTERYNMLYDCIIRMNESGSILDLLDTKITNPFDFPNIGYPEEIHEQILERFRRLRDESLSFHGYNVDEIFS